MFTRLIENTTDKIVSQHNELKDNVLTLISTLALAHKDALTILLTCGTLIPSLILFLANVSRPIWEDDEEYLSSYPGQVSKYVPSISFPTTLFDILTARIVEQTVRTISLLHYMTFTPDPPFDVRFKLHRTHARHLVGSMHSFIVTLGRCAFTNVPEWIDEEQHVRLEQAIGTYVGIH